MVQIKSAEKLFDFFSTLEVSLICYEDDEMTLDDKSDLSDIIKEYLDKAQKFGFGSDSPQERGIKVEKKEKGEEAEEKSDEKKKKKKSKSEKRKKYLLTTDSESEGDVETEKSPKVRGNQILC